MTPSDSALIQGVLKQDTESFTRLFDRYHGAVCDHLVRMVRENDAAEDLAQEVFLRVWRRADQWSGQGSFRAWLFRIATNLALNHLRSQKRRREQPLDLPPLYDEDGEETPAPGWMVDRAALGPDIQAEHREQRRLLHRFVSELSEDKREVLQLVHDSDMELQEVARRLAIPEGTVKSRLFHARKQLAEAWRQLQGEQEDIECR